jgi:hypothetical protein
MHEGDEKCRSIKFKTENLKSTDQLEYICVEGRIILKWILNK